MKPNNLPSRVHLIKAAQTIKPWIHNTPVVISSYLNDLSGASLFFKCEQLQRMGAFKMRGAVNAIHDLDPEQRKRGVVTHSSGNFGQAVALAAKLMGLKADVVMPLGTPKVKRDAVINYGAKVTDCDPNLAARESATRLIVENTGATALHPSNSLPVILGNATAAMELLEEVTDLDSVLCPVGGGGLLAGTALAALYFGQQCQCWGAEPLAVNDAYRSMISGKIEINKETNTIADGLKTNLGSVNFPIIKSTVSGILLVEESEIIAAMRLLWERTKMIIEPSSAVVLAAVLKNSHIFKGQRLGLILSGGNVDLGALPF